MSLISRWPAATPVLVLAVGRGLQVLVGVASVRLATEVLPPDAFGTFSLLSAMGSTLCLLLVSPLGAFWTRKLHAWQAAGLLTVMAMRFLWVLGLSSGPVTVIVWLLLNAGSNRWSASWFWSAWIVLSGFVAPVIANTYINSLNLLGWKVRYVLISLFIAAGSLGGSYALVRFFGPSGEAWYSGAAVPRLILAACTAAFVVAASGRRKREGRRDQLDRSELVRFSSPLWAYGVVYFLQVQSYPFLFGLRANSAALGLFAAGMAVGASTVQIFATLLAEIYNPEFFKGLSTPACLKVEHSLDEYVEAYVPALVAFALFVASVHGPLGRLLLSPGYRDVSWIVLIGVAYQSLLALSAIVSLGGQALMKTRIALGPAIVGGVFTVLGMWMVLPLSPLLGGGAVLVGSLAVSLVLGMHNLSQCVRVRLPWRPLGRAIGLSLPLAIVPLVAATPESAAKAVVSLGLAGIYALAVQGMLLSRRHQSDAAR